MKCPKWITAQNLDSWAETQTLKPLLPDLLRRLVFATVPRDDLGKIDFPAGEEIQRPGYDGVTATSIGTTFVPSGITFWELGCVPKNPKRKAQEDYNKRILKHEELIKSGVTENLKEATFIAVTPCDWQGGAAWASERERDDYFANVRAYDSNILEHWIQDAPAVGLWLAQQFLGPRNGVYDLLSYWKNIQASLRVRLPPAILLINRKSIVSAFENWLKNPAGHLAVKAPSAFETAAVFCAWVHTLPEEQADGISSRAIVIETRESWQNLATSKQSLIFIPSPRLEVDGELVAEACRQGHYVLKHADFRTPRSEAAELPIMRRFDLQTALSEAGMDISEAQRLSKHPK